MSYLLFLIVLLLGSYYAARSLIRVVKRVAILGFWIIGGTLIYNYFVPIVDLRMIGWMLGLVKEWSQ